MAKGKRGPGRPNKLRLDWLEPESTFNKHFPNLSQLELEKVHKELYIQAFQAAAAEQGGKLAGAAKKAFKNAFKKQWGVLLIPDRSGKYLRGRLGDAPLWRVRYGDTTFVPTISTHVGLQQRVWRAQFLTNAGVGTPLSLEQLKKKFVDPLSGETLTGHHLDGLSEANPYIDDTIEKLVSGQVHQSTKGKYGSLADVKAGNREFQQAQRVFEKRKIAAGDVLEQFNMLFEGTHTKSPPTSMGGGAVHVQQSLEGVSTASGAPITDKLPDGTRIGDLDPEVKFNTYVDEVERLRPIKDRIIKKAITNPDLYPDPFANPSPIEINKRGKLKGKPKDLWASVHPAQTLLDNPDIGTEGVRMLTPRQGYPSRLPYGMQPSGTPDPWDTIRALNGSAAAPRSVGAAGFGAQLAPSSGSGRNIGSKALDVLYETNPENYMALQDLTKAGTTVGRRVSALMPFIGAAGDVWDVTERYKTMMNDPNTGVSDWLDKAQFGIATATVGTTWYAEPINTALGLTNLGIDIGRTIVEEDKRKAAGNTLRALGTAGMHSIRDLSKTLW